MNNNCRFICQSDYFPKTKAVTETTWSGLRRMCGIIGAGICLVLGVLGMFLPLLPATPFILLASYLLCRCSPRLHSRFRTWRLFSQLLTDWEDRGGIRKDVRLRAIVLAVMCSSVTLYFGNLSVSLMSIVILLLSIGLFVIFRVPLVRDCE